MVNVHSPSDDLQEEKEWNDKQLDWQPYSGDGTASERTNGDGDCKNDCESRTQGDLVANNCGATLAFGVVSPHLFPPDSATEIGP